MTSEQDDSPTELDFSKLSETKIAKKERERSMWEWIDRYLDDEFFETAGKITDKEGQQKRMNEIPELLKPLAYTIITLACADKEATGIGGSCILFRHELFSVHKELLEKGIDIHLPHAWFCDGVMIEPEWIVRITNGIIGWSCDPNYDNPDTCGLENCRYRGLFDPSIATTPPITEKPQCDCHSVPGDSKNCNVHTERDHKYFLQGLEAGMDKEMDPCLKCGKILTWHEKKVCYCFTCHPHEPPKEPDIDQLVEVAHQAYCDYWNHLHPEFMKRGPADAITRAILKKLGYQGEVHSCPRCGGGSYLHLGTSTQVMMDHSLIDGKDHLYCPKCNEMTPIEPLPKEIKKEEK